jgi:hypothetical protein
MSHPPPGPLVDLLLLLFRSNDDLMDYLLTSGYRRAADLVDSLPATSVPRRTYFLAAVGQLQAHGLDRPALFAQLIERRPSSAQVIEAARRSYAGETTARRNDLDESLPAGDLAPPSPDLVASFEKIMGERHTFLDVAYLALGYERARSVALLRMRFGKRQGTGTAFLVAPDILLTAHHNLWHRRERADEIDVEFDFERSTQGTTLASSVVRVDPSLFVGSAADDWALLRLPQPQTGRPLAPLARNTKVAKEDRVAIIQHPEGMLKQVALHHNLVTYVGETRVQYLADTLPGSSGSPVFDAQWNVVAIHHAGGELPVPGTTQIVRCNQGIAIQHVLSALARLDIVV